MHLIYTLRFRKSYKSAPEVIKKSFDRKVILLVASMRHPSLHAKKYDETRNVWQARITRDWRFYFTIQGDVYTLIDIMKHPK